MKKSLKIVAISLSALLLLVLVAFAILCFNVFSPSKLTKIVNSNASKVVTNGFHTDRAELTFFKTFPKVGVDMRNASVGDAQGDTLLSIGNLIASIDIREYLKNKRVLVHDITINNGTVNVVIDEKGNPNYNVFKSFGNDTEDTTKLSIDLKKVKTNNVDVSYSNLKNSQKALLKSVNVDASGNLNQETIEANIILNANSAGFSNDKVIVNTYKPKILYSGKLVDFKVLDGLLDVDLQDVALVSGTDHILDTVDISLKSDVYIALDTLNVTLDKAKCRIDNCSFDVSGSLSENLKIDGFDVDAVFETQKWDIDEVLDKIPPALIGNSLDNLDLHGNISLLGSVKGSVSDSLFPRITSRIAVENGDVAVNGFPLTFHKVDAIADLFLHDSKHADLSIANISATTLKRNRIAASGTIRNLLGKMLFDVKGNGKIHVQDFTQYLPKELSHSQGVADFKLATTFPLDPDNEFKIGDMTADLDCGFTDFNLVYEDSIIITSPKMNAKACFPTSEKPYKLDEWLNAVVDAKSLNIKYLDNTSVSLSEVRLDAYTNDLTDSSAALRFGTTFDIGGVSGSSDTISFRLAQPHGKFVLFDSDHLQLDYSGGMVNFAAGKDIVVNANNIDLHAKTAYNGSEENPILQWNPDVTLNLTQAVAQTELLKHDIVVPALSMDFNKNNCKLKNAKIIFGESDVSVLGNISGIESYIKGKGMLKGGFDLTANNLNLNEIIDVIDGFGAPDSLVAQAEQMEKAKESTPFIVPFGVDVNMKTTIKHASFEDAEFRNIAGQVYVKDGVLVLEEMGLTNDAARMQLTALYRTPRLNHLFLGFDFHLLDIKIDKLIEMIPEVDTVLPMLKSFSGNAEFHFAAETYLKSNYDIKYSTLRGAAAIKGHDLVVLDSETYKMISKKLMFNKKTQNKIDSLSTEITIYKNEVDVYPFLLSIDKYRAVISGRHNLDMTYNYNISLLKPLRIGLDIIGMNDRLKYKVGKAKYADDFLPERKNVVESNILELKSLISKSLRDNVKD